MAAHSRWHHPRRVGRRLFCSEDPVLAAYALIAMIDGLALQVLLASASMSIERMRAVCDQSLEPWVWGDD